MGIHATAESPYGSEALMVSKLLGPAYQTVKLVADNIDLLLLLQADAADIILVGNTFVTTIATVNAAAASADASEASALLSANNAAASASSIGAQVTLAGNSATAAALSAAAAQLAETNAEAAEVAAEAAAQLAVDISGANFLSNNGGTVTGATTFSGALTVQNTAYGAGWDGSSLAASRDAVYDKMETLAPLALIGVANGIAPLDATSKIAAAYLPSYVDDVLEYANLAAFPVSGETGKIYIAIDTGFQYRWGGATYTRIVSSPGTTTDLAEGVNLYFSEARVLATPATGLADTAGTPVAADSILTVLGKVAKALYTDIAATIRGTVATGLADTAGTPAAADSILTILGKLKKTVFTDGFAAKMAVRSIASTGTLTPTFVDDQVNITALGEALNIADPTGTAQDGWAIVIRIKDNGTARLITYGGQYRNLSATKPATTVIGKTMYILVVFNAADTKWDVLSVRQEA